MKQKLQSMRSEAGFTLVELLVVLAIMTLIMGALVIDFTSQRGRRNIVLAKNETITNLRKVQSYMLSSRNIEPGIPARYYLAVFDLNDPTHYKIQAIDNNYNFYEKVETVSLPASVKLSSIKIGTAKAPANDTAEVAGDAGVMAGEGEVVQVREEQIPVEATGEKETDLYSERNKYNCIQVIFSAPFGKMYTNATKECSTDIVDILKDPVRQAALSEKTAQIYFTDDNNSNLSAYIELVPPTGQMSSN